MAKKNSIFITALCLACIAVIFGGGAAPSAAYANSAQSTFFGVDATGAMMADSESPVVVEKERLVFDLNEFPSNFYETAEEFLGYGGKVTAEYTFYNPSQYTVTSKLLFPFGKTPDYYVYDSEGSPDDSLKYGITLNGEPLNAKVRHTYSNGRQFDVDKDLALVCDGYVEDEIFSPEMTVTEYKFSVGGLYGKNYTAPYAAFEVQKGGNTTYIFNANGGNVRGDVLFAGTWVNDGETLTVYAAGEPKIPQWKIYNDGSMRKEIDAQITLKTTRTLTFKELAMEGWDENGAVSETDWYNASVACLNQNARYEEFRTTSFSTYSQSMYESLMRWYEYEITFAPGEKVVNSVTAPMYPLIDLDWEPSVFKYTYLLSPAKTWKEFGELKIEINTPYFVTESGIGGFEKTETGYSLTLDGLPDGELTFTLCSVESPGWSRQYKNSILMTVIIYFALVLVPLLLIVAVIVALVVAHRRNKRKRLY